MSRHELEDTPVAYLKKRVVFPVDGTNPEGVDHHGHSAHGDHNHSTNSHNLDIREDMGCDTCGGRIDDSHPPKSMGRRQGTRTRIQTNHLRPDVVLRDQRMRTPLTHMTEVKTSSVPDAGSGLFAKRYIAAGTERSRYKQIRSDPPEPG
jgi:hypothetical protein